ncbi:MAG TPA: GAF domain-containing sensor histidine kinase [Anaerolineales bacterium]
MSADTARQLERIQELVRGLSMTQDTAAYLQELIYAAMELISCETASLLEVDAEAHEIRFMAVPGSMNEVFRTLKVPVDRSAAGWVVRNSAPLIINDVSRDPRHFRQADSATGFQTRMLLAVPLKYHGKVIGVFEALNKAGEANYTEDDVTTLETLGALACSILENDLLERRVQNSLRETSHLDRLKSDFIAITSHELRTPLGLILGHATFLHEMLDRQYAEQVEAIIRNASKLKDIVDSLSSANNYQAGTARLRQGRVDLRQVAAEVAASFEQMAGQRGISLTTEADEGDLSVGGDATKIAIALSNLVKNALTFTNENGHVVIRIKSVPGFVQVSVADDGIGIPPADLPRIFERFFQVESHLTRRYGGMGLGLSVARSMVEMHGGRIWAESVEGQGSTFSFLLPLDHS